MSDGAPRLQKRLTEHLAAIGQNQAPVLGSRQDFLRLTQSAQDILCDLRSIHQSTRLSVTIGMFLLCAMFVIGIALLVTHAVSAKNLALILCVLFLAMLGTGIWLWRLWLELKATDGLLLRTEALPVDEAAKQILAFYFRAQGKDTATPSVH